MNHVVAEMLVEMHAESTPAPNTSFKENLALFTTSGYSRSILSFTSLIGFLGLVKGPLHYLPAVFESRTTVRKEKVKDHVSAFNLFFTKEFFEDLSSLMEKARRERNNCLDKDPDRVWSRTITVPEVKRFIGLLFVHTSLSSGTVFAIINKKSVQTSSVKQCIRAIRPEYPNATGINRFSVLVSCCLFSDDEVGVCT